jgi:hypothetical protein
MLIKELDDAIEYQKQKEGTAPSFFERIQPFLAKSAFGILSIILLLWIASSLNGINSKIQSRPVLAEIDGTVKQMKELPAGERSTEVIHAHIVDTLSLLLWMGNKVPKPYGGGENPMVKVPGIKSRIPKTNALAALNIVDENRIPTLRAIVKKFPANLDKGETTMLRIYKLGTPQKTADGYKVEMLASLWTVSADNTPLDSETLNRTVYLRSVLIPPKNMAKDSTAQIVNVTMGRGLMIDYLEPLKNEQ